MPDQDEPLLDLGDAPAAPSDGPEPLPDLALPEDAPAPPEEARSAPPSEPVPLGRLLLIGAGLALLCAIVFDTFKLREARLAVQAAGAQRNAALAESGTLRGELETVRGERDLLANRAKRDACDTLAAYLESDGLRMIPLQAVKREGGATAQLYLPQSGPGCVIATGKFPAGTPVLWHLSGGKATRVAALREAGAARLAEAAPSGRGQLVITLEPDAGAAQPTGAPFMLGRLD